MDPETPRPRLRGLSLHAARAVALVISIGVVALVAVNAGIGGCRATAPGIQPDSVSPVQANAAAPPSTQATPDTDSDDEESGFMGGAKAPAGAWARPPRKPSPQAPSPPPAGEKK